MTIKVFNLSCEHDHPFEGWFASAQEFERQLSDGLLECPVCASHAIHKSPSAPRIGLHAAPPSAARLPAAMPNNHDLQAAMVALARRIATQCEDVGDRFSEEARRIHYEEAPRRGIRGTASAQDVRELADEGIDVLPVPLAAGDDSPLH